MAAHLGPRKLLARRMFPVLQGPTGVAERENTVNVRRS